MTQQEYAAQIRGLIANAQSIDEEAAKAALKTLAEAHTEILREIAALPTDTTGKVSYSRYQLQQLQRAVERAMDEFQRRLSSDLNKAMSDQFQQGAAQVDKTLKDAIGVSPGLTVLPRHNLMIAQDYTAELVTGLSNSAKARLNAILRRSALGGQPVDSIMRQIGATVDGGEFGKISRRAQTIYRTEVGRMAHSAQQARLEEAAQRVEKLEKQWVHVGVLEKHPRAYHLAIHGEHVSVDHTFPGSGPNSPDDLMYPGDPAGAAEDTINCACAMMAWTPAMEKFAPLAGSRV